MNINEEEINQEMKKSSDRNESLVTRNIVSESENFCRCFSRYSKIVRLVAWARTDSYQIHELKRQRNIKDALIVF